jgi:hypothetical protein
LTDHCSTGISGDAQRLPGAATGRPSPPEHALIEVDAVAASCGANSSNVRK